MATNTRDIIINFIENKTINNRRLVEFFAKKYGEQLKTKS